MKNTLLLSIIMLSGLSLKADQPEPTRTCDMRTDAVMMPSAMVEMMLDNQTTIINNQGTIMEGQERILRNQDTILANQGTILKRVTK